MLSKVRLGRASVVGGVLVPFLVASVLCLGCSSVDKAKAKSDHVDEVPILGALLPAKVTLELSKQPRLDEEVDLICTVTPGIDVPKLKISFRFPRGVEPVSGRTSIYTSARKGETKTYRVTVKFKSSPATLTANVGSAYKNYKGDEVVRPSEGATIWLYLVDEEAGLFGTELEYRNSKLEFRYNPADGIWLDMGEPGLADWNKRIIDMAKKLEPAMTDSEALCLHADIDNVKSPYKYLGPVLAERGGLSDEIVMKYLLEQGWLRKHREGGEAKLEWLRTLSKKHKQQINELKK